MVHVYVANVRRQIELQLRGPGARRRPQAHLGIAAGLQNAEI